MTRLVPAAGTKRTDHGRVIMGGAPFTVMQVSDAGASMLDRWFGGHGPDWESPSQQNLAHRLVAAGLCLEVPTVPANADPGLRLELTIVIPVRDDDIGLVDTLDRLSSVDCAVIVVDDGSESPILPTTLPTGTTLLRNTESVGPGQARDQALALVTTRLVAFIDAGVLITAEQLAELARFFSIEQLVAAAPRVRSIPGKSISARYDAHRSPLDMGPTASLVGAGKFVPYVPTACLMVLRSSVVAIGGFDPALRYGEDVDLVWRLGSIGSVRYVPSVEAYHPARESLLGLARQRIGYGSSAAPLALRHGDAVAPVRLSGAASVFNLLALLGRPLGAAIVYGLSAARLARRLKGVPDPMMHAWTLVLRSHWFGWKALLAALCRSWWPIALVTAVIVPSRRRQIVAAFGLGLARRLLDGPRPQAAADVMVGAVDDIAYGFGVWLGAVRHRTIRPLLPAGIVRRQSNSKSGINND